MSNQIVITSGAKLRDLDDVIIGTDGILSSVAFNVANGVPRLDENGKILVSQLPNSVMEFKGVWNAATNSPTLVNGTGNAGDVWLCNVAGTVNFGAGPIVFAVGDYAVYTGTEWARSSGATGTVTSVGVSRDGNALTISGSPVTSAGTINLGFSGDNTQYINGAGNLTTFPTVINIIGLTMPAAFGVSNSPLVANGTIGVTALGFPSQYIRGDGTLADFPTSGGGGSSVSYYLNGGTSQGTIGGTTYYEMSKTADTGTMADFSKTGDGLITAFLTDAGDPSLLQIPAGNWNYEIYASMSANGGVPELYAELYVYNGTTFTLISTSSNEILYDGTNLNLYSFAMTVPETVLTVTDRLAIKLYATNSGGKTTTVHTQDSHLCQVITTFTTGLTALNGLTSQVQYFGTGTSGSDFNIVSSVSTHTFNIPSASATARGLITTGTQTIAGSKTITGTTTFTGGPILSDTNLTYANSGYTLVLQSPTLSVNRTVTLPNGTGTLALTSDISYPVSSVFGRTGAVVATSGDYTTTQVTEGLTNLYFTDARARTAISLTTTGSTGAATYNNTTGVLNIPNYADQYVGTVTSVGLSAPTGFSVSGSPVTSSGTLALSFASGYSLPTNVKQSNWDDAYTWVAAFPTQTGNNGKFLTTDGSSLSWAANPLGTVTSVAMSVPTGLTVSGSPITTSGTLAVTLTAGYSIPTNASQTNWDTAYTNRITSLTTTGTSGAATLTSNTLNIPQYQAALTNPVTGTGGNNYIAKFTSTGSTIGNSIITESGTNITISGNLISNNGASSSLIFLGDIINTTASFFEPQNGGKTSYFGRENSTGTWVFATAVTPYSTVIAAYNTTAPIILGHNNAEVTISNGGATLFSSTVTASSLIKTGGTSSQFLKADGSVDSSTYLTTSSAASTYLPLAGGTLTGPLGGTSATFTSSSTNQLTLNGGTTLATRLLVARGTDDSSQNLLLGWSSITVQRTSVTITDPQTDFSIIQQASNGSRTPFYISSGGKVGISTDSPFSLLHVGTRPGAGSTNPSLGSILTVSNDGLTGIDLGGNVNANNVVGHINWVNYLGVGNYNTARIDVYANGAGNSGDLRFWTASVSSSPTIRLTISSSGVATFVGNVAMNSGLSNIQCVGSGQAILRVDGGDSRSSYFGKENGSGNYSWSSGGTAYATVICAYNQTAPIQFGHNTPEVTILNGGATTFISSIDLTGNITTTTSSSTAYGIISGIQFKNSANSGNVKAKIVSINGADSDDMGLSFQTSTNSTNVSEKLRIVGSGAATFSSSVTATSFFESSDSRLKTLIQDNYQTKGIGEITPKLYTKNGKVELGYYAQDFIGVLDNAILKGGDEMLSLSYREVHTAKIYALEQRIKELEFKLN